MPILVEFDVIASLSPNVLFNFESLGATIIANGSNIWPPDTWFDIYPDSPPGQLGSGETFSHLTSIWRGYYQYNTQHILETPATAILRCSLSAAGGMIGCTLKALSATWTDPITSAQWGIGSVVGTSRSGPFNDEIVDIPIDVSSIVLGGWSQFIVRVDPEDRPNPWYYPNCSTNINGIPELITT